MDIFDINITEYLFQILIFISGAIFAVIFKIILQEPVSEFLARSLKGRFVKQKRGISGVWECCYRYPSKGNYHYERQLMKIKQSGSKIYGENITFESHDHIITGDIKDSLFLTGRWKNITEGDIWVGTYQFVLSTNGNEMAGKWLGFNSENKVQQGPWYWEKISSDISKKSIEKIREEWEPNDNLKANCEPEIYKFKNLLELYGQAWQMQNKELLTKIFTKDAVYQERAFERPYRGIKEIQQYWQKKVINEQSNIEFELLSFNINSNDGYAEWKAVFDEKPKGVRKEIREVAILRLRDNKIYSLREYWTSRKVQNL